jgi:hypothetical protein
MPLNGGLRELGFAFIIIGRAAVAGQPSESALDHPALGQNLKAGLGS